MKAQKQALLQLTDVRDNHNKYYRMTLYDNGKVLGEWGRVGAKPQQKVYTGGQAKFYEILTAKERKGYRIVDTPSTKANIVDDLDGGSSVSEFVRTIYRASGKSLEVWLEGSINQISAAQIDRGKAKLNMIHQYLGGGHRSRGAFSPYRLRALLSDYYSTIPHKLPRDIRGIEDKWNLIMVGEEFDHLQDLEDALNTNVGNVDMSLSDMLGSLGVTVAEEELERKDLEYLVHGTQSRHHFMKVSLNRVWHVEHKSLTRRFERECRLDNMKMLFHGTRTSNLVGLLSRGFLIKPPGVPLTGSMFGNGIYFADQSTKSIQYCSGGRFSREKWPTYLILAEVKLGRIKEERRAQSYNRPPRGYNSVMGVKGPSLLHNEYIIYDPIQADIRYVAEIAIRRH